MSDLDFYKKVLLKRAQIIDRELNRRKDNDPIPSLLNKMRHDVFIEHECNELASEILNIINSVKYQKLTINEKWEKIFLNLVSIILICKSGKKR